MRSGKSQALINCVDKYNIAGKNTLIIKPKFDTRDKDSVKSRNGSSIKNNVIQVSSLDEVEMEVNKYSIGDQGENNLHLLAFDEFHFFETDPSNIKWAQAMLRWSVYNGTDVVVSGLDLRYQGNPFQVMGQAMCVANEVEKFTAICCDTKEDTATMTFLDDGFRKEGEDKIVGGDDMYKPLSRRSWTFRLLSLASQKNTGLK